MTEEYFDCCDCDEPTGFEPMVVESPVPVEGPAVLEGVFGGLVESPVPVEGPAVLEGVFGGLVESPVPVDGPAVPEGDTALARLWNALQTDRPDLIELPGFDPQTVALDGDTAVAKLWHALQAGTRDSVELPVDLSALRIAVVNELGRREHLGSALPLDEAAQQMPLFD